MVILLLFTDMLIKTKKQKWGGKNMGTIFYESNGKDINVLSGFQDLINYDYRRDATTGAFYTAVNVPQKDATGNKQYPFMIWPNYPNGGTESCQQMSKRLKFLAAINGAGINEPYGAGVTVSGIPMGIIIQNGVVLKEGTAGEFGNPTRTLTIDGDGTLDYAPLSETGAQLAARGIISTASGFFPIVKNFEEIDSYEPDIAEWMVSSTATSDAQRQCLCQYENGDYLILTSEGRGGQGGGFFTFKQMQSLCIQYGVKFAYMLDGGGSASTVVGEKQLNHIYENTYGRVMPTYLVFNGTTTFKETNA